MKEFDTQIEKSIKDIVMVIMRGKSKKFTKSQKTSAQEEAKTRRLKNLIKSSIPIWETWGVEPERSKEESPFIKLK